MRPATSYHPQNKNEAVILAPVRRVTFEERWLWAILLGLM